MKLTTLIGAGAIAGLLFSSCSNNIANQLTGEWDVVKLGSLTITPESETPYLGYDGEKIYVTDYFYAGCIEYADGTVFEDPFGRFGYS